MVDLALVPHAEARFVKDARNLEGDSGLDGLSRTSTSLIRRLRVWESTAWDEMADLYGPLVFHWARQVGLRQQDAEDVVQEVFQTVARKIHDFRHEGSDNSFRGWLRVITRNKIGNLLKQLQRRGRTVGDALARLEANQAAAHDPPSPDEDASDYGGLFQRAFSMIRADFKEPTWRAFWLTVMEERPVEEVAASLELSANAVYIAKSRVLRRLRDVLGDVIE